MKFYKDTDGIWYADEKNIIVGDLRFIISSPTEISIYWVGTRQPLYNGLVTGLQTSAGASYTDMADFLTACGSFFVNPLDKLETDVKGIADYVASTLALKEDKSNKTQILTNSETDYPSGKAVYEPMVNTEHAIADIVAHIEGRIKALEELLTASKYNTIQVKELSVVENIKLKGADTKLFGTGAPIITPDFAGQEYLDQTAKIWYDAVGIVNAGDWKPRTNA